MSATREAQAVKRFFQKTLGSSQAVFPRVITVDKNAAYPKAFRELKADGVMPVSCELRQSKYLSNLVEQDHRFIKRLVKPGMGFFSFHMAWRTLQGYEVIHMKQFFSDFLQHSRSGMPSLEPPQTFKDIEQHERSDESRCPPCEILRFKYSQHVQ